jgi:hypothetical protein
MDQIIQNIHHSISDREIHRQMSLGQVAEIRGLIYGPQLELESAIHNPDQPFLSCFASDGNGIFR